MGIEECLKELNLEEGYTKEKLKKAYLNLAKKFHPDASPDTTAKMQRLNEAYETLLKELEEKSQKEDYTQKEDLSLMKSNTILEMYNKIKVDSEMKQDGNLPSSWLYYREELFELYVLYRDRIKWSTTKVEIELLKKEFNEEVYNLMNRFAEKFFQENPHLENRAKENFETFDAQLKFYKKLIEQQKKKIIFLIENTPEYKIAKNILGLQEENLNTYIIKKVEEKKREYAFHHKEEKEIAKEIVKKALNENQYGKIMLHILSFLKETEALFLWQECLMCFTTESDINQSLLNKIQKFFVQKEEEEENKKTTKKIELCQELFFNKDFSLEKVWSAMSFYLGILIRQKKFERNQEVNKHFKYMIEILELAKRGIISVDTLMYVEKEMLVDFSEGYIEGIDALEYALNLTTASVVNPDYLFVELKANKKNPLAVLHRGKSNYELFFENELDMMQKIEIKNLEREKIVGYIPIRKVFLNGEFIGKKIDSIEILYLYEGYYLTMDYDGNITFYKKEHIAEDKFTEGDKRLEDPEYTLVIICDIASNKYASLIEEEKEMRKRKK